MSFCYQQTRAWRAVDREQCTARWLSDEMEVAVDNYGADEGNESDIRDLILQASVDGCIAGLKDTLDLASRRCDHQAT